MKRSTWMAVLLTAAVLGVAGAAPRWLPRAGAGADVAPRRAVGAARATTSARTPAPSRLARRQAVEAELVIAGLVAIARLESARARLSDARPAAVAAARRAASVPAALAVLAALTAVAAVRMGRRSRRLPVARVLVLARGGHTAADIARACGLSQDAVRALLRPGPPRSLPARGR